MSTGVVWDPQHSTAAQHGSRHASATCLKCMYGMVQRREDRANTQGHIDDSPPGLVSRSTQATAQHTGGCCLVRAYD